jgi:hypothetical protein
MAIQLLALFSNGHSPQTMDIVDLAIHGDVCQNLTFMAIVTSKIPKG